MKYAIIATVLAAAASAGCSSAPSATSSDTPTSTATTGKAWTPTGELVYVSLPPDLGKDDFVLPVLHRINADGSGAGSSRCRRTPPPGHTTARACWPTTSRPHRLTSSPGGPGWLTRTAT